MPYAEGAAPAEGRAASEAGGEGAADAGTRSASEQGADKLRLLGLVGGTVAVLDLITKAWVLRNFALYESVPVVGDFFRLTYTHNPGAAFGINIGEHSRIFFLVLALLALGVLLYLYAITPVYDRLRLWAVALVSGGAVGNIVDRIRFERGVVDFLDFGVAGFRWPVFNVADTAVSVGAVLLLISFYFEERRVREREEPDPGA